MLAVLRGKAWWRGANAAAAVGAAVGAAARAPSSERARRQRRLALVLFVGLWLCLGLGVVTGAQGIAPLQTLQSLQSLQSLQTGADGQAAVVLGHIRAPRSLGAALVGGLLGLAGALAQGLFRNPLADPFLLGSAAGAVLGVVLVLAAASLGGFALHPVALAWWPRAGLALAAFVGALGGVMLTLALARGAQHTLRLLLAGVVVAVLLAAVSELLSLLSPDAMRGKQAFALGNTSGLGWPSVALMAAGLWATGALALRDARGLDALTLGEDSAASLGVALGRLRFRLVLVLAAATALAVSQAGLVAFVGLVAPHVVRRLAPGTHRWLLTASAAVGALLLLAADVVARAVLAPQELPVGVVTAVLGGVYLCRLLYRVAPR